MNDRPIGASHVADVAYDFCRYYMAGSDGCRNCGGLPHTKECFVGRFVVALGLDSISRDSHDGIVSDELAWPTVKLEDQPMEHLK